MTRNQEAPPPGYDNRAPYPPQPSYNNDSHGGNNSYGAQPGYSNAQASPPVPSYGATPTYGSDPLPQPSYQINQSRQDYAAGNYSANQGAYPAPSPSPYQQYPSAAQNSSNSPSAAGYREESYVPPAGPPPGRAPLPANDDPNGERGIMGALAGGAAGGYAGHKVNHGFLGALGGAFAGHKLEDAYKDKKKDDKKKKEEVEKQQQQQQYAPPAGPPPAYAAHGNYGYHQAQSGSGGGQVMAGNFSGSSREVALDRDYDLIARCRAVDGSERLSSLSLNKHLGNDNGAFCWLADGGNFVGSARNIVLTAGGRVLEAELRDRDGGWRFARVVLDERIGNSDGELVYC